MDRRHSKRRRPYAHARGPARRRLAIRAENVSADFGGGFGPRGGPRADRILAPESGHEAHLPAEEAQARADARVQSPDANAQRARDPEAPAPQGPKAPGALTMATGDAGARRRRR